MKMSPYDLASVADLGDSPVNPIDVEDALGVTGQINRLSDIVEEKI